MKKSLWILLILGLILIIILIILIIKLSSHKMNDIGLYNNVDSVKNSCFVDCSKNDSYYYCDIKRDVKDGTNPKFSDTCYNLANSDNYSHRRYDIPKCPQIDC